MIILLALLVVLLFGGIGFAVHLLGCRRIFFSSGSSASLWNAGRARAGTTSIGGEPLPRLVALYDSCDLFLSHSIVTAFTHHAGLQRVVEL